MSKFRAFFGLNDGDDAAKSHRKRRTDYMKKIQRLVVPEDENGEAVPAPENIVTAPPAENEIEAAPAEEAQEAASPEVVAAEEENEAAVEQPRKRVFSGRGAAERGASAKEKGSFVGRFLHMGDSLRRPGESGKALILVKSGAVEMVEDIEDALVSGQNVLIDFEREDRKNMETAATKLVNFIRLHKGSFYAVTRTSMLLTLGKDAVMEWRPGGEEE